MEGFSWDDVAQWGSDIYNYFIPNDTSSSNASSTGSLSDLSSNPYSNNGMYQGGLTAYTPQAMDYDLVQGIMNGNNNESDTTSQTTNNDGGWSWDDIFNARNVGSAITAGATGYGAYTQSQNAQNTLAYNQDQLEQQQAQFDETMAFNREQLAQQMEIEGAKIKLLKKQIVQQAYKTMVESAISGGQMTTGAMANIGTLGKTTK